MWRQLLDQPDCWIETSGSAMFTYAMIEGIKNDWLDAEEYAPIARKAWMGMVTYVNEMVTCVMFVPERIKRTTNNIIMTVSVM